MRERKDRREKNSMRLALERGGTAACDVNMDATPRKNGTNVPELRYAAGNCRVEKRLLRVDNSHSRKGKRRRKTVEGDRRTERKEEWERKV